MSYEEIKQLAERDRIAFKKHAVLRMHQRKNLADEVKYALINGETIEKYPKDRPLPSQLVLGYTQKQRPIHAVIAIDTEELMLWIITVYQPELDDWEAGFKKRKIK